MTFRFDENEHRYFIGNQSLPSVTGILQRAGLVPALEFYTELGRDVGSSVHDAIHLDIQNQLDWDSLHPLVKPLMDNWDAFKMCAQIQFILGLCEKPLYHPDYLYAGKPDIFAILNGRPALIDVKCSMSCSFVGPQTAAYAEMPEIKKHAPLRYALYLKGSNFKLVSQKSSNDWLVFLNALKKRKGE